MDTSKINSEAPASAQSQERIDADNLNMLTLCHFILGGVTALFSCLFIMHIVMGTMMIHNPGMFNPRPMPQAAPSTPPYPVQPYPFFPPFMGYMFVTMGTIAVLGGWTLGALTAYARRCLKARRNYRKSRKAPGFSRGDIRLHAFPKA